MVSKGKAINIMMYVNAPKAKESRFVTYDYLCNYNQGPRPAMFYPTFFAEWNLLCLLSSRANQLGVLGQSESGGNMWCEYEMEEGAAAVVQNISVTEETFPLGMAVDFTSERTFTAKDESTFGPCPVIFTLSTGGGLNMFHVINRKPGAEALTCALKNLPNSGHRTPQQYRGAASYITPADGAFINIPKFTISTPSGIQGLPVSTPATTTEFTTPTGSTFPVTSSASSLFNSSVPEPLTGTGQRPKLAPFSQQTSDNTKPSFSFTKTSPGLPAPGASASTSSFFGTAKPPTPSVFNASCVPTFSPFSSASGMPISTTGDTKESHAGNGAQQTRNTTGQGLKFTFQLPQASSVAGSISQGKPALNTINVTPLKAKSPPTRTDVPKQNDAHISSRSPDPAAVLPSLIAGKEVDSNLISTIAAATAQFEEELHSHVNVNESINEIGEKQEMGTIRKCIIEESEWINQMSCTTVELKAEISQLHSEVLEGYTLLEEAEAQLNKSKNPRYFLSLQSRPLDPRSRKKLEEIRSLYQYLQSQMVEINTRLHLDWAAFTNNMNNKKKLELPASETLYQALRKCNSLRRMCERQVDTLCDRLKALQISFLTFGLSSHRQYEDDDCLANLERALRETTLSTSPRLTLLKMLPPQKQTKLQKVLSQRKIIPLRKCSNIPKMDLTSLETLSLSYGQNGLPDRSTSQQMQQSFPSNLDGSMSTSFGPQTFSTPNRISKLSSVKDGVETPKNAVTVRGIPGNVKASVDQTSSQFVPLPQVGSDMSSISNAGSKNNKFSALCVPTANKTSGFTFSSVSGGNNRVIGNESVGIAKPQYEDVTPPQTPDNKLVTGMKAASPLLALSSLVSKVPTTTAVDATPPSSASHSEVKSIFGDAFSINLTSDVAKSLTTDAAAISLKDFTPKSLSSLKTTLPSSVPFSFTPFSPPTTVFSAVSAGNSSAKAQDAPSGSFLFKLPSTAVESTSTTTASQFSAASQANVTSSSFAFKSTTLSTTNSDTPFIFKSSTPASGQLTSVSSTNSEGSLSGPGSSSVSSSLSKPSNLFSGMIPGTVDISSNSSLTITAIPFTSPDLAGASISSLPSTSSETTPTAESDSASSASTDSDTVSNANIGSDNVPFQSGSISFRLETSAADELEIQAAPTSTLTAVPLVSSSSSIFNKHTSSVTGRGLTKAPSDDAPETSQESESSGLFENNRSPTSLKLFSLPTSSSSIFGGSLGMTGGLFGSASEASGSIAASNTTATVTTITTTAAATKSSSIFGGMTSSISMFGSELGSSNGNSLGGTPSSTDSLVNSISSTSSSTTSAGIFSPTPGRGLFASSSISSGGLFSSTATTSSGGLFAVASTTSSGGFFASTATTSSGGLFSSTATTSSGGLFANTTTTSSGGLFSITATSSSGGPFSSTATTSGGLFSSTATTTSGGLFSSTATTTSGELFSSTATTTSGGLFSSTATTSSGSLFGTTLSLGGGQGTGSIPTTSSIFGSSLSSASSTGSLFGASSSAVSSPTVGQTSAFGTTTTSSGSAFSSPSTATSGFSVNTTSTTGGSAFGQTATQSSSGFGQNSQSSGSLFGTPTTTGSVFGNSGQSGSLFGSATSQGTGIFGGTPTQSSGSSVFGQPTISSGFNSGSDGSVFGQSSAASSSPFSTTSTSKPETSLFGSSAGFGAGTESGGGFFSGLGSKPSEESASKNVFGSTAFSAIKPQSSLFGGSSTNSSVFGSSVFGNTTSSASNSNNTSATGQVAQSGFGVTSPQSPTGFGSGTAFGSPPSFGGAPSFTSPKFGSPPTFGGTATFGSPLSGATGGGFSSFASTGASTFGSVANSSPATSPGFGSFSGQNSAASFGGLAQSANQQQSSAFGSGTNVFGSGSNFSSWR
ncbi:nuclear pore complex protein Nup214 isoform X2 [Cherax quadricarinatus]|uniref:nuclear pore complex protein Nup214 isoform X2 n=1 Tax=Cherax quadricarinatus TaxID=27406 RepID=UPI00387ED948